MRTDGKLNGPNHKMGSHVKEKEITSFDVKELEEQIAIPLKQMIQEDEAEEQNYIGEAVTRLTGNVRACYLNHLEKILMKNYEVCCEDCSEWPLNQEDVIKCAIQMERKALRSCMVVILYQRAMTRLATDIKKHTEQLKLYRQLKDCITSDSVLSDKTTQTGAHIGYTDKATQIDMVTTGLQHAAVESHNLETETKPEASPFSLTDQCFQPSTVKMEPSVPEAVNKEPIQGIPIPVYVSGMSTTSVRSTEYFTVNGIEHIPYYEMNQEFVPNINTDSLFHYSIISNEIPTPVNHNGGLTETFSSEQNRNEKEPYEWSIIEKQTRMNARRNAAPTKTVVSKRKSSNVQQHENFSDGTLYDNTVNDLDLEECPRMSIDDRISSVLRREAYHFSKGEQLHDKIITKDDREPSAWTVEKCHQQKLLHAKIFETCFDVRKRGRMRLRFLELFSSDSDDCFDVDEHVTNFKDRIARWVVESLMPYYREGRILSRPLFKFLARHIADTLLLKNHVPDEADVEQCVIDFFSHHDVIKNEDDVKL
ncbi:uncharacterized protein LOC110837622 isoform X2 [Zootermopsis nevadensis]|uniref:uncharacterized protein LOC110837622 isoform X2 n=1 Tax=Zootermopsis nevadensis TaxID=136037 RepID=UPI000B8E5C67|nr:uncharacterized protein LOC110837622 isoform X2 [Zootermopsis nevadensis]